MDGGGGGYSWCTRLDGGEKKSSVIFKLLFLGVKGLTRGEREKGV